MLEKASPKLVPLVCTALSTTFVISSDGFHPHRVVAGHTGYVVSIHAVRTTARFSLLAPWPFHYKALRSGSTTSGLGRSCMELLAILRLMRMSNLDVWSLQGCKSARYSLIRPSDLEIKQLIINANHEMSAGKIQSNMYLSTLFEDIYKSMEVAHLGGRPSNQNVRKHDYSV